jgi:hypothetical protein
MKRRGFFGALAGLAAAPAVAAVATLMPAEELTEQSLATALEEAWTAGGVPSYVAATDSAIWSLFPTATIFRNIAPQQYKLFPDKRYEWRTDSV